MHFLVPILLLGLAGTIVPVLVHWLHRRRAARLSWGAMQFLRPPAQANRRRSRFEQGLLLAIRMAAVATFALALAGPRARAGGFLPSSRSAKPVDLAIVLDHSLSTGRLSDGKTVFVRASVAVADLLAKLRENDSVAVVLAEHSPRTLTQLLPASDRSALDRLRDELVELQPGLTACSIPDAIAAAGQLIQAGTNPRKLILVISDQQRLKWQPPDAAAWQAARAAAGEAEIVSVPISADGKFTNATVDHLSIEPRLIGPARPIHIRATVRNTGTEPLATIPTLLLIDGRPTATSILNALAPGSSAEVNFELESGVPTIGPHTATVSLDIPDALAADNTCSAAMNILRELPVLIIDGQFSDAGGLPASRFLEAALHPDELSLVRTKLISLASAESERLDSYLAVILNDCPMLSPTLRDRLLDFAQTGHGVWCILGPRTQRSLVQNDLATAGLLTTQNPTITRQDSSLVVKDFAHPIIAAVAGKERNAFVGAKIHQWWSLRPADSDVQTLLSTSDSHPLVLERPIGSAGGVLVLWTTDASGAWNNLQLTPNFLPLAMETVYELVSPQLHGLENRGLVAGQPIEWTGPATADPGTIRITLPEKTQLARQPALVNGRWLLTFPGTFEPGLYRMDFSNSGRPAINYAVNIDPQALDGTQLDRDDIAQLVARGVLDSRHPTVSPKQAYQLLKSPSDLSGLWGVLGGLVLGLLVLETWMTHRLSRRSEAGDTGSTIQPSWSRTTPSRRIA